MALKKKVATEAKTETQTKYEQKDFSGALFENKTKEKETHPDLNGSVIIEGVEYWVSGWQKTSKKGEEYISLAFKPKDSK